jgi:glycerophosphoryl diester phosphodiesterase
VDGGADVEPVRRAELARLTALPFAHRGLHGAGRAENSLAAFAAAIDRGHGVELDVRLTLDGRAAVFHDEELDRLAEATGPVVKMTSGELRGVRLRGSSERIPMLEDVLQLIRGRVPLLVELKAPRASAERLCATVARTLHGYLGPLGVMSFNPEVGDWFAHRSMRRLRGLVVSEHDKPGWRGRIERYFAVRRARPDFLACDIRDLPSAFATQHRARGLPVLTWTVRSEAQRSVAAKHADQIIFEAEAGG